MVSCHAGFRTYDWHFHVSVISSFRTRLPARISVRDTEMFLRRSFEGKSCLNKCDVYAGAHLHNFIRTSTFIHEGMSRWGTRKRKHVKLFLWQQPIYRKDLTKVCNLVFNVWGRSLQCSGTFFGTSPGHEADVSSCSNAWDNRSSKLSSKKFKILYFSEWAVYSSVRTLTTDVKADGLFLLFFLLLHSFSGCCVRGGDKVHCILNGLTCRKNTNI